MHAAFFFDGKFFYDCVRRLASDGASLSSLICANHPSLFWTGLFSVPERLFPGNVVVPHLLTLAIATIWTVSVAFIIRRMLPDTSDTILFDVYAQNGTADMPRDDNTVTLKVNVEIQPSQ